MFQHLDSQGIRLSQLRDGEPCAIYACYMPNTHRECYGETSCTFRSRVMTHIRHAARHYKDGSRFFQTGNTFGYLVCPQRLATYDNKT